MTEDMRRFIFENVDSQYAQFHSRLCPDTRYRILGVRMPKLRKYARELARVPAMTPPEAPECYEEVMLLGLAAGYRRAPLQDKLREIAGLLPLFDCWAFTDCVAATYRFAPEELPMVWEFALYCLSDSGAYSRRFGLVLMLLHLLKEEYYQSIASAVSWITDENYYVRMAQAWLLAELGTRDFELVTGLLQSGTLEIFTHNKTISKLRDSYRITPAQKDYLKQFRRKEGSL